MSFFWSLLLGWFGVGVLVTAGLVAAGIFLPLPANARFVLLGCALVVGTATIVYERGYAAADAACEERHRVATEIERKRQQELATKIIEQDGQIARLNEQLSIANQGEIDATPVNTAACLDRAGAGRVRRVH